MWSHSRRETWKRFLAKLICLIIVLPKIKTSYLIDWKTSIMTIHKLWHKLSSKRLKSTLFKMKFRPDRRLSKMVNHTRLHRNLSRESSSSRRINMMSLLLQIQSLTYLRWSELLKRGKLDSRKETMISSWTKITWMVMRTMTMMMTWYQLKEKMWRDWNIITANSCHSY